MPEQDKPQKVSKPRTVFKVKYLVEYDDDDQRRLHTHPQVIVLAHTAAEAVRLGESYVVGRKVINYPLVGPDDPMRYKDHVITAAFLVSINPVFVVTVESDEEKSE